MQPGARPRAVVLSRGTAPWISGATTELEQPPRLLNEPFVDWQVKALRNAGVEQVRVLRLVGPPGSRECSATAQVQLQPKAMGTAGCLDGLREWLRGQPFLLVFGSTYLHPSCLRALLERMPRGDAAWLGTAGITGADDEREPAETICTDPRGALRKVCSRHRSWDRRDRRHLAGVFLLSDEILPLIPRGRYFDLKEQLLPAVAALGRRIDTVTVRRSRPVFTPEDHLRIQFELLNDGLPGNVAIGRGCAIDPSARIVGPVLLGDECTIGPGCVVVGPAVLGARCRLEPNAVVQCSALEDDVIVGREGYVGFSLLGAGDVVEARQRRCNSDVLPVRLGARPAFAARAARALYAGVKRAVDIVVAGAALVAASPLLLAIACAVKLDSPGPALFQQRRCGKDGREFLMHKFRSMVHNADSLQAALRESNEVDGPTFKLAHDPRITRVGRFLRRTSLDELPQLLNVIAGHMSLVGPRPLAMQEMSLNAHWRDSRLSVPAGITGLWQVEARDDPHFHRWVELDLQYARSASLLLDLKILVKTVTAALKGL